MLASQCLPETSCLKKKKMRFSKCFSATHSISNLWHLRSASIVELGKDLYYDVTVVKIENDKELSRALGCSVDKVQGNYIYKTLDENELPEFLDSYSKIRQDLLDLYNLS